MNDLRLEVVSKAINHCLIFVTFDVEYFGKIAAWF